MTLAQNPTNVNTISVQGAMRGDNARRLRSIPVNVLHALMGNSSRFPGLVDECSLVPNDLQGMICLVLKLEVDSVLGHIEDGAQKLVLI